ncbi:Spore germination protein B3 precursor [compost metagenome]
MRIKRLILCIVLAAATSSTLSGCWNSRELNKLAIVSGIGIDLASNGKDYKVTFQIVIPSATSTSKGATTQQPGVYLATVSDPTLFGALRKASRKTTRQLFFAHTQLLVIGESMARKGIDRIFDIFERSHELRLNTPVLLARDSDAESILKVLIPIENISSIGLVRKSDNSAKVWGEIQHIRVVDLVKGITGEGEIALSGIMTGGNRNQGGSKSNLEQTEPSETLIMKGMGLFKDEKLTEWIDGSEARGIQWVTNKINETVLNVKADEDEGEIAVNIFSTATHISTDLRDETPVFHVSIREEGTILETHSSVPLANRQTIKTLQEKVKKQTIKEVEDSIRAAQQLQADVFNFGNELKRINPSQWDRVKDRWPEVYAKGELDVKVEVFIRNTGMRLNPYKTHMSK